MLGIGKAVEESNRHGLDVLLSERFEGAAHARVIERDQHVAMRIDAFADRQA